MPLLPGLKLYLAVLLEPRETPEGENGGGAGGDRARAGRNSPIRHGSGREGRLPWHAWKT